jgi:hypothetical protein
MLMFLIARSDTFLDVTGHSLRRGLGPEIER